MRKEDLDQVIGRRPFVPFEIRMVDGRKYSFKSVEQFLVSRSFLHSVDKQGHFLFLNIALISSIRTKESNGNGS